MIDWNLYPQIIKESKEYSKIFIKCDKYGRHTFLHFSNY
jgi:hypothetical protein